MKKLIILSMVALLPFGAFAQDSQFFEKQVRPVLAKNCYECHSASASKVKGDLLLDTKEGLQRVTAGKVAEKTMMMESIINKDMPPKNKLSSGDASILFSWIRNGAKIPTTMEGIKDGGKWGVGAKLHWSFQPLHYVPLPDLDMENYSNPIDIFIAQKLGEQGLSLSKQAKKRILIRRAFYDLTGLPPTMEEVESFVNSTDSGAYDKLIDQLLASPRYGERWGRYWLDVARYSDHKGGFRQRRDDSRFTYSWTYRNWVIKALNNDKPYDDFIKEQLAADLLGYKDDRLNALGFLTLGRRDRDVNNVIDDRIDTTAKAFLGLTVTCARCHDHKFDPISQADYYALHGIFNSIVEPEDYQRPVVSGKPSPEYVEMRTARISSIEAYKIKNYAEWYDDFRRNTKEHLVYSHMYYREIDPDLRGQYSRTNKVGRSSQLVNRMLSNWNREMAKADPFWRPYQDLLKAKGNPRTWNVALSKMSQDKKKYDFGVVRSLQTLKPANMIQVAQWYGNTITAAYEHYTKGKVKNPRYKSPNALYARSMEVLLKKGGPIDVGNIDTFYRALNNRERTRYENGLRTETGKFITLEWTHKSAPERPMLVADRAARDTKLFKLGNARTLGDTVPRRFIEFLDPKKTLYPKNTSGRLQLAESIVAHPLAARVIVNRVWMHHFGTAFVNTPDDLGMASAEPSHEELANWLSAYLKNNKWSLKQLHKLIMTSQTYMQSSLSRPQAEARDSGNRLYHRQNIQRLEFESLRDTVLQLTKSLNTDRVSGSIDLNRNPEAPVRTIYAVIDRSRVPELFVNFDFADPNMTNGKRFESTIPQQALFLLNNKMIINQSKKLAASSPTVNDLYRTLYQRDATKLEENMADKFLASVKKEKLTPKEQLAQALLLSNELIYIN
tara:strand:- start:2950 stop:5637 length:2688 start_codon:yes stop_codon:yes gene_type:complete